MITVENCYDHFHAKVFNPVTS